MITGFLGAGKTSFLRELLEQTKQAGLRSDVILNDHADANLDASRLTAVVEKLEPLTATCACCEGLDFLLDLSKRPTDSELLFVELNGTADPVPIVESFTLFEAKLKRHPRWQVCVIHPELFSSEGRYQHIQELQLQTATHIYISHQDEYSDLEDLISQVKALNPVAQIVSKEEFTASLITLGQQDHAALVTEALAVNRKVRVYTESTEHQSTHEFNSCALTLPRYSTAETVRQWLANLPEEVIRAKVLIGLKGVEERFLFERIGQQVSKYTQRIRMGNSVPSSAILIGPGLDVYTLSLDAERAFGRDK